MIRELALFGSVLRPDFHSDSDVDVLVAFADGARWRLADYLQMETELAEIFGRRVDMVERNLVEKNPNYIIRDAILNSMERLDVA